MSALLLSKQTSSNFMHSCGWSICTFTFTHIRLQKSWALWWQQYVHWTCSLRTFGRLSASSQIHSRSLTPSVSFRGCRHMSADRRSELWVSHTVAAVHQFSQLDSWVEEKRVTPQRRRHLKKKNRLVTTELKRAGPILSAHNLMCGSHLTGALEVLTRHRERGDKHRAAAKQKHSSHQGTQPSEEDGPNTQARKQGKQYSEKY